MRLIHFTFSFDTEKGKNFKSKNLVYKFHVRSVVGSYFRSSSSNHSWPGAYLK